MLKVNNKDARMTPNVQLPHTFGRIVRKLGLRRRSGVFTVNFEHISHLVLVLLLSNLNMYLPVGFKNFTLSENCRSQVSPILKWWPRKNGKKISAPKSLIIGINSKLFHHPVRTYASLEIIQNFDGKHEFLLYN